MSSFINALVAFILISFFVFIFIGLVTLLAQILFFAISFGLICYVVLWVRNKLFPNSIGAQRAKAARDSRQFIYNFYKAQHKAKKSGSTSTTSDSYSSNNSASSSTEQFGKSGGRIIDVEPEKHDS
jgi:hypothetical protein